MNTARLAAMQRYYLEALGRRGRVRYLKDHWWSAEPRLAFCWYASGFAADIDWIQVGDIARRSWFRCREPVLTEQALQGALSAQRCGEGCSRRRIDFPGTAA